MRVILASKSPARLATLRAAGVNPTVLVSGVDENTVAAQTVSELALALAEAKGNAVLDQVTGIDQVAVIACDSILEFHGRARGKPENAEQARHWWRQMRGEQGVLHTGHFVAVRRDGAWSTSARNASTIVRFSYATDAEIDAYIATGEPVKVAGAFTIDGFGGPFISSITGDPHNVVGISLPVVRQMLADHGISWAELWAPK